MHKIHIHGCHCFYREKNSIEYFFVNSFAFLGVFYSSKSSLNLDSLSAFNTFSVCVLLLLSVLCVQGSVLHRNSLTLSL